MDRPRTPGHAVLKLKMLYLQAQHGLSFEATEHLVRDRLCWMGFCGLSIADPVPDANTLWDFRKALIWSSALKQLFARLDQAIKDAGYLLQRLAGSPARPLRRRAEGLSAVSGEDEGKG